MAHGLHLIRGEGRPTEGGSRQTRLSERSRRPGLAHEEVVLALDVSTSRRITRLAMRDRVPLALWAVIGIESERALLAAAPTEAERSKLALQLDATAGELAGVVSLDSRLDAYASALRGSHAPGRIAQTTRLELLVPYHSLRAWQIAASHEAISLQGWARRQLLAARPGRSAWEAAAALRGQTLGEWIALGAV